ncbi:MAG: alanine transaminase [Candidatus Handelsmanbacteria bacterium RIFCSPLOWO2_12_FULL_64_10]|uniref:Alanine transaminase n=1 Tax=Handelsmanbacteria sp. (strain RIFCSPLOWO2_12_FULL_64_10) TaxID=1817868 RepID=A0A1F6D336_HANXR|nr:MAG: alanine transaminase [Candidatus Handelsmanbacteria bacterium RIFCSPLOWO2_12_FULL_64_10]
MTIDTKRLQRLPPYVFAQINEQKLRLRQQGVDVIDLGMGNPDQPAPPHIIEKLCEVAHDEKAHRYSSSRGIPALRKAICRHYQRRFGVDLDWQREVITAIGSKEGLAHICLALLDPGDLAVVPNPAYPIHIYGVAIAGGNVLSIPLRPEKEFVPEMEMITREVWPRPKIMIFNFPHNPTTATVDVGFFEEVVAFARKRDIIVIHDLAYSDIVFDGYVAPSFMQVPGAREVGVEFFTMSKSYNMAGWRVGFCVGNPDVIDALAKIKGYMDYGIFTPVQVAAIAALDGPQDCVKAAARLYQKRRDTLVRGLNRIGWPVLKPRASMFVWAPIPGRYREMGSMAFAMQLMKEAEVAVSPGVGFGDMGEGYVRISLVENEQRIQQAVRNIKKCLKL